jgi:hypothetical protein
MKEIYEPIGRALAVAGFMLIAAAVVAVMGTFILIAEVVLFVIAPFRGP